MASPITDIVVTTRNRLDGLRRTLSYIYERTRSPYRLHVLDDASSEGNVDYLMEEFKAGRVHHLLLHGERVGAMAQLNMGTWMAVSDPIVFVDDDILCPDVEPDWLARGLRAMDERPRLGLLALNHPNANRRHTHGDGVVTYCLCVGGTFMFARRNLVENFRLPHFRDNFGVTPTTKRSAIARKHNYQVGFLADTYCFHTEEWSSLNESVRSRRREIEDVDPKTLEPLDKRFRGPYGTPKL